MQKKKWLEIRPIPTVQLSFVEFASEIVPNNRPLLLNMSTENNTEIKFCIITHSVYWMLPLTEKKVNGKLPVCSVCVYAH